MSSPDPFLKKASWGVALATTLVAGAAIPSAQADLVSSTTTTVTETIDETPTFLNPQLRLLGITQPEKPVEIIVQLRPNASADKVAALVEQFDLDVVRRLKLINALVVEVPAGRVEPLADAKLVRAVTPNGGIQPTGVSVDMTKLAPKFALAAKADQKWKDVTGKGVGVAVIDSGIQGDHADFRKPGSTTGRVVASVVTNVNATSAKDTVGHGTHVASTIGGDSTLTRDTKSALWSKYEGVAPEADLVSIKVDDANGEASVGDVIAGVQWAIENRATHNIRVLNLSLNSDVAQPYKVDPLNAAVEAAWFKGIVVVAAAGNRGTASDAVNYAPANDPYVITVGGTDDQGTEATSDDVLASWSSRGTTQDGFAKPDVTASGARIAAALSPGSAFATQCLTCVVDGEYLRIGGTSMATAVVSGVVANLLQVRPGLKPDEVKGALVAYRAGKVGQVDQGAALIGTSTTPPVANRGLTPNDAIDPQTGEMKSSASWTRSSWSAAPGSLNAGWSRSSWSCGECTGTSSGTTDWTRSSWSRSSWSVATGR